MDADRSQWEAIERQAISAVVPGMPMADEESVTATGRESLCRHWRARQSIRTETVQKELSGGSITNVVRRCAIALVERDSNILNTEILVEPLANENGKI